MSGDPTLTRAKRFKHLHTSHKTQFAGSEIQHVKTTLTASVDGDYTIKADKIAFENPVAFQSTASIDGNLALGGNISLGGNLTISGNLAVTGSMIVTSSVLHKGDNIFGDEAGDLHKFRGITTASGPLYVAATLIGQGNASLDGTLNVGGAVVLNSTASIDGTLAVGGNTTMSGQLDMSRQKIVGPKNVLRSEKTTVTGPFTGLASQSFPLFRASPGDTIYDQYANVTIGFASLGVRQGTKMEAGDAANDAGYGLSLSASPLGWKWVTASLKGAYLHNATNISRRKTYTIGTLINAKITASDMLLASLSAGTVDFYVDVMSRS